MKRSKILDTVKKEHKITSIKLAKKRGIKRSIAEAELSTLCIRKGLLDREPEKTEEGPIRYIYSLSEKGKKVYEKFGSYKNYSKKRNLASYLQFNQGEDDIKLLDD